MRAGIPCDDLLRYAPQVTRITIVIQALSHYMPHFYALTLA